VRGRLAPYEYPKEFEFVKELTMPPLIVHTVEVAMTVPVPPAVTLGTVPKLSFWVPMPMTKVWVAVAAR
jgi:hypothetical protein